MDIKAFLQSVAKWQAEQGKGVISPDPQKEYCLFEERRLVKDGLVLLKLLQEKKQQATKLALEIKNLEHELDQSPQKMQIVVDLQNGSRLTFDLSQGELFQQFWRQVAEERGQAAATVYDPSLLSQESDDLLTFLP